MKQPPINDPAYWRERAQEARRVADQLADAVAKQTMLEIAQSYDNLAAITEKSATKFGSDVRRSLARNPENRPRYAGELIDQAGQARRPLATPPAIKPHYAALLDDMQRIAVELGSCSQTSPGEGAKADAGLVTAGDGWTLAAAGMVVCSNGWLMGGCRVWQCAPHPQLVSQLQSQLVPQSGKCMLMCQRTSVPITSTSLVSVAEKTPVPVVL